MSSSESEEEESSLSESLELIEKAEVLFAEMRRRVTNQESDPTLTASKILQMLPAVMDHVARLKKFASWAACEFWASLIAYLETYPENVDDNVSRSAFWDHFKSMLRPLSNEEFAAVALEPTLSNDGNSLLHEVCKLHPPIVIVKQLVELTTEEQDTGTTSLMNLDRSIEYIQFGRNHAGEYPLHVALEFGASLDVVK